MLRYGYMLRSCRNYAHIHCTCSDEQFQEAVRQQQTKDQQDLEAIMGRKLAPEESLHLGVHALRDFLEELLQGRYRERIPAITSALTEQKHTLVCLPVFPRCIMKAPFTNRA